MAELRQCVIWRNTCSMQTVFGMKIISSSALNVQFLRSKSITDQLITSKMSQCGPRAPSFCLYPWTLFEV
jgi:hypothetical protein